MLLELKQKTGQLPSDYYLLLKDTALDCELHLMKEESILSSSYLRTAAQRGEIERKYSDGG